MYALFLQVNQYKNNLYIFLELSLPDEHCFLQSILQGKNVVHCVAH